MPKILFILIGSYILFFFMSIFKICLPMILGGEEFSEGMYVSMLVASGYMYILCTLNTQTKAYFKKLLIFGFMLPAFALFKEGSYLFLPEDQRNPIVTFFVLITLLPMLGTLTIFTKQARNYYLTNEEENITIRST